MESSSSKKGSKNKKRRATKPKAGAPKKKKEAAPKGTYLYCGKDGHWKHNCKVFLKAKKNGTLDVSSTLGIYLELSIDMILVSP